MTDQFEVNGKLYDIKLALILQEICDLTCRHNPPDIGMRLAQAATDYLREGE